MESRPGITWNGGPTWRGIRKPYHVAVYFVVDETTWNTDQDGRAAIHRAFGRFVGELAACEGIEVDQDLSQVISGGEFRWQAAQATDEWNFANLSHRET